MISCDLGTKILRIGYFCFVNPARSVVNGWRRSVKCMAPSQPAIRKKGEIRINERKAKELEMAQTSLEARDKEIEELRRKLKRSR